MNVSKAKKRGRKAIPKPQTLDQAFSIADYGELGADPWMAYLRGNPFIEGKSMEEVLKKAQPGSPTLEHLKKGWSIRFGWAIGLALERGDYESIQRFADCAKVVLKSLDEPLSDPSGYQIVTIYMLKCWVENVSMTKEGFVKYCRLSPYHKQMPDIKSREIDRRLKWARPVLDRLKKSTTK